MLPEEALNLSPSKGGGYYPATIHKKLNGEKYEIIRKLGYGPRSSTLLVLRVHDPEYFAVKVFTIAASKRACKYRGTSYHQGKVSRSGSLELPTFHDSFWEDISSSGSHLWSGSHFCIVMNPLSTSVKDLQQDAKNQRFPVHVVQRILWSVSSSLNGLHNAKIMHGRVRFVFFFHPGVIANPLFFRD